MSIKELIGKTVTEIRINETNCMLYFRTSDGVIKWEAFGDCCSHSWFNDILIIPNLIGHQVMSVEDLGDIESFDQGYDLIQVYGYRIVTANGFTEVIFRNESNGYYGGYLEEEVVNEVPSDTIDLTNLIDWSS
jgi:hypothetical protein